MRMDDKETTVQITGDEKLFPNNEFNLMTVKYFKLVEYIFLYSA